MDEVQLSKFLSLVLRHKPEAIGLVLDSSGWVPVADLLKAMAAHGKSVSLSELQAVVANSEKKRFAFSEDSKMIRASQGHSVEVSLGYESAKPPERLYHGTASRFVDSIRAQGLLKRQRHHVHLSSSIETASSVGARYGKLVLLEIDSGSMFVDGYAFYLSDNGVWLTDHVPVKYINFEANEKLSS